jgi:hypothetical protein
MAGDWAKTSLTHMDQPCYTHQHCLHKLPQWLLTSRIRLLRTVTNKHCQIVN